MEYEITKHEGRDVRLYDDGIMRDEKGRIVSVHPAKARAVGLRNKIIGQIRAGEAIADATGADSVEEGVKLILKARAEVALTDKGRAGNDAAKLVLLAAGFLQNEKKIDVEGEVIHRQEGPAFPEEYLKYLKIIAEKENRDVIEGVVKNGN